MSKGGLKSTIAEQNLIRMNCATHAFSQAECAMAHIKISQYALLSGT